MKALKSKKKSISVDENVSLESGPMIEDGDAIGIHSIASKIHNVDVKSKKGQAILQKIMPELCEKVIE